MAFVYSTKNQIEQAHKAENILVTYFSQFEWVEGITLIGGIARDNFDKYSDIDTTVWVEEKGIPKIENILNKQYQLVGHELDIDWKDITKLEREPAPGDYWDDESRLHMENSKIIYDPKNRLNILRKRVTTMTKEERESKLTNIRHKLQWLLTYVFPAALERNSLYQMLGAYLGAIDYLIQLIYVKQDLFVPQGNKQRFIWFELQKIPQIDSKKKILRLYEIPELSKEGLVKKTQKFNELLEDLEIDLAFDPKGAEKGLDYWRSQQNFESL